MYGISTRPKNKYVPTTFGEKHDLKDFKKLKLVWKDGSQFISYDLTVNTSYAGFWYSSGPDNGKIPFRRVLLYCNCLITGSVLISKFNGFAGNIQVLKAVGNHMVLLFCHQLPVQKVFTMILSRIPDLHQTEIHGVHNLLNRRGLNTVNVKKICVVNGADIVTRTSVVVSFICFIYLRLIS